MGHSELFIVYSKIESKMFQVCDIIDKLLAKNAEDRYQSAEGLLADLRICMQGLRSSSCLSYLGGKSELQGLFSSFPLSLSLLLSLSPSFSKLESIFHHHTDESNVVTTTRKAKRELADFEAGKVDRMSRFSLSQKLYGREKEIALLSDALKRVVVEGATEVF